MTIIINMLMNLEKFHLKGDQILAKHGEEPLRRSPSSALHSLLQFWASESNLPVVLLIDEIDSLIGDSLVAVLRQLRTGYPSKILDDDIQYATDLGLITLDRQGIRIANPIYQEVVPRQLTFINQTLLKSEVDDLWYMNSDGSIAVEKLLTDFQKFFRENSESWIQRFDYREAGPQLLLQAYLQRVINVGGRIEREYGLGRMRTDLLLVWPYVKDGVSCEQRAVFELKIQHRGRKATLDKGLSQISLYLDRVGEKHGHLLISDRDPTVAWEDKIFKEQMTTGMHTVTVWGM